MAENFQNGVPFDPGYSKFITSFMDVGRSLGSAIRRAIGGSMCPI